MKLVQKAIKKALVSEETAKLIKDKAVRNSGIYGDKKTAEKTFELYSSLIIERREYIANGNKRKRHKKTNTLPKENFNEKLQGFN